MGKKMITGGTAAAFSAAMALSANAGGIGEPEIEPEVFTATDAVAAGSLGGAPGLILVGLIVGGLAIAGDSN